MSRVFNEKVFDDTLVGNFTGSTVTYSFYTSLDLAPVLGSVDQLAVQSVSDQFTNTGATSPTISAQIEHSGDGRTFKNKNGSPEIAAYTPSATQTQSNVGSDGGSSPSLGRVRIRIDLTASGTGTITVHVKLFVTGRDQGATG